MFRFICWCPLEVTDILGMFDLFAVVQFFIIELIFYLNGKSTMFWYGGGSC